MKNMLFNFSNFLLITVLALSVTVLAQNDNKPRASLKASSSQTIGVDTEITITYSRPGVKGRKIWGDLVPWGLEPGNKYSDNKPFPWRGGANENTTIQFSKDVVVGGSKLPAGKYGMHFIPGEKEWTVIFSKNAGLWGSYQYNEAEDALRIKVNSKEAPLMEWLTYGFEDLTGTSATAFLHWEKVKITFKIATAE